MDVGHWSFGHTLMRLRDDLNVLTWLWEEERWKKNRHNITVSGNVGEDWHGKTSSSTPSA
jgi:hypothetical protein